MIHSLDYLVKPFQDSKDLPVNGCEHMEVPPFAHNPFLDILQELKKRHITPEQYLVMVADMWKKRVNLVVGTLDRLFLVIDIFGEDQHRPEILLDLRAYAESKLKERFVSLRTGTEAAHFLVENRLVADHLDVEAYGEISDRCARGEMREVVRVLLELSPNLKITRRLNHALCPDQVEGKFNS